MSWNVFAVFQIKIFYFYQKYYDYYEYDDSSMLYVLRLDLEKFCSRLLPTVVAHIIGFVEDVLELVRIKDNNLNG